MATTTNYGWTTPDDTALVKDGAAAIRSLGTAIDTTVFNNAGAAIAKTIVDAKGDIIAATAADTVARLAVGTNSYILTADSSTATGLKWAAPAGGGKVLQVVQATYATQTVITSTSYTDSGLSATITPTLATSKVLVLVNQNLLANRETTIFDGAVDLRRGNTSIYLQEYANGIAAATQGSPAYIQQRHYHNASYLDSPATTSATTYKTMGKLATAANSAQLVFQQNNAIGTMILLEIGA